MLHTESRKGGSKSYHSITFRVLFIYTLLTAILGCKNSNNGNEYSIADKFYANHIEEAKSSLKDSIKKNKDITEADKLVYAYYQNGGEWVWALSQEELQRCDTVVYYLKEHVQELGFKSEPFFIDTLLVDIKKLKHIEQDSSFNAAQTMARLELNLSRAFFRYTVGQQFGFINPRKIFNSIDVDEDGSYRQLFDIKTVRPDSAFVLKAINKVVNNLAIEYLEEAEPTDNNYLLLKEAYLKDSTESSRKIIMLNMERCRWQIHDNPLKEDKFIFVNIPAQNLWAVNKDSVLSMRICCGTFSTKTPLLVSKISLVQFNPEWGIPMSIIKNEVSAHAGDSAYFARHRYQILNTQGDTINPKTLTPTQLQSGGYRINQKSGPGNSLGRIIFRFPNQFSVYLHDTNMPNAFKNERRTVSHGCVRVQRPFELTQFVLPDLDEWTTEKIRLSIDMKPETEKGKKYLKEYRIKHADDDKPIRLVSSMKTNPQTPLYIGYYTAFPNPDTKVIEFWPDRYEFDLKMGKAMKPFIP